MANDAHRSEELEPGAFDTTEPPESMDSAPIGYEAADPSLQAPLWCEAMAALSTSGSRP